MDVPTIVAIAVASFAGLGVGITLIVLIVRGGFLLGSLVTQVNNLGRQMETLTSAVNELRAEVQQNNQTLAALANHTHDTDGKTVFRVPPGPVGR